MQAAGGGEEGMAQRGRKLVIEWAAEDDAAGLQARYRRERQADVRPRLHGLWLLRTGRPARGAAGGLGRPGGVVGFADERRLGRGGTTRRGWGRRGVKVRQRLQLRYDWCYLVLAVDARAGTLWWGWVPTMRAQELPPLLGWLRDSGVAALVWDGAPSHRDAEVRGVGLPLIGLPPYSPELNPAERLFEEVRRQVEGQVYATLDAKVSAVDAFLEDLDADPARVRQLCGWAWIETAFEALADDQPKAA